MHDHQAKATTSLKWNIILSALKSGRTVKLNHMDVLEADREKIVAGNRETGEIYMTFLSKDIGRPGAPQIEHFEGRYFNDKGVELRKKYFSSQPSVGLSR